MEADIVTLMETRLMRGTTLQAEYTLEIPSSYSIMRYRASSRRWWPASKKLGYRQHYSCDFKNRRITSPAMGGNVRDVDF